MDAETKKQVKEAMDDLVKNIVKDLPEEDRQRAMKTMTEHAINELARSLYKTFGIFETVIRHVDSVVETEDLTFKIDVHTSVNNRSYDELQQKEWIIDEEKIVS